MPETDPDATGTPESAQVATTRAVIEAISAFRFDAVGAHIHPDIVVEQPMPALGMPPVMTGRDAFVGGLGFVEHLFERFDLTITQIHDCAPEPVVVFEQVSDGRFRLDGSPYSNRYLMIFTFTQGLISRWVEIYDSRRMTEIMGPVLARMQQQESADG
jgi:ketosteroid isomerase-like protein